MDRVVIAALVLAGFLLRIAGIHEYGLSLDEAQFVWVASSDTAWDALRYVLAESPHPPGHVLLLHVLMRVSRSLLWLRLPSIVAGTFLIWVSYRFAGDLFGRAAGIAMAVLVAFSPALVDLSRVCRNYMPGLALQVLALWLFVRFLRNGRWRDLGWFAVAELLAVLWAYAFVVVFAAVNLTLAVAFIHRRAPASSWLKAVLLQLPLAMLLGTLYPSHIANLPPMIVMFHEALYRESLRLRLDAPLEPVRQVWEYLVPEPLAPALFWLGTLGMIGLLLRGEWLKSVRRAPRNLGHLK